MKSPVLEYHKDHGPQLILIQEARLIDEQDTKNHEKWRLIKQWYDEVEGHHQLDNAVNRTVHSIINAIVYQERKAFCLGLEATRQLRKQDTNWKKNRKDVGLKNAYYDKVIARLTKELCIIERIFDGSGKKKLSAYKLVHPAILDMIQGKTMEEQIEESIIFAKNNKDLDKGEAKGEAMVNPLLLPQEKPNDYDDLPKGEAKGEAEVRSEKKEVSVPSEPTKQLLSFKDFIYSQCTEVSQDIGTGKEEMYYLAEDAVANAEIDSESSIDRNMFDKYLRTKVRSNKGSNNYVSILVDTFYMAVDEILAARKASSFEFKAPEPVTMQSVKREVDKEKIRQEKVSMMLRLQFSGGTVARLREELEQETDELQRKRIQAELEIWGG
jgi:hypothetical protein